MKPFHIAWFVIVALAATPAVSSAGPETKASSDAEASGREHFQRGQRLSARGEYAAAYREFAAGYALTERPLFLFNMAEAARASGDLARARDNYQQFLRLDPKNALAATAQARLAEIDRAAAPAAAPTPTAPAGAPPAAPKEPAPAAATTQPAGQEAPVRAVPPPNKVAPPHASVTATQPDLRLATRTDSPEATPIWRQWPFWAVVGGVVAGSAVLYAATRDGGPCGGGCTEIDFR